MIFLPVKAKQIPNLPFILGKTYPPPTSGNRPNKKRKKFSSNCLTRLYCKCILLVALLHAAAMNRQFKSIYMLGEIELENFIPCKKIEISASTYLTKQKKGRFLNMGFNDCIFKVILYVHLNEIQNEIQMLNNVKTYLQQFLAWQIKCFLWQLGICHGLINQLPARLS